MHIAYHAAPGPQEGTEGAQLSRLPSAHNTAQRTANSTLCFQKASIFSVPRQQQGLHVVEVPQIPLG